MAYTTVFANLAAGQHPASLIDGMFNIAGQQGNVPCTATGTNAITLAPDTGYYLPAAYTKAQIASFKAVATSSGPVTIQIGGLALIKLYTAAGVQADSGDVVINTHYEVQYWADLDLGSGAFIILNATVTAIANPVAGVSSNLKITNGGTPTTQVALTADAAILQNSLGGTVRVTTVSLTISTASTGANGLDTGTVANSTWYAVYIIYNSNTSTTAGLLSTNATSPTLPSGYTYYARFGWVRTNSSAVLLTTLQYGNQVQYVLTTASGVLGTYVPVASGSNSGVMTATLVTGIVPSTATKLEYDVYAPGGTNTGIGPNANNTTAGAGTGFNVAENSAGGSVFHLRGSLILESTSIYYSGNNSACAVYAIGWEDNL